MIYLMVLFSIPFNKLPCSAESILSLSGSQSTWCDKSKLTRWWVATQVKSSMLQISITKMWYLLNSYVLTVLLPIPFNKLPYSAESIRRLSGSQSTWCDFPADQKRNKVEFFHRIKAVLYVCICRKKTIKKNPKCAASKFYPKPSWAYLKSYLNA